MWDLDDILEDNKNFVGVISSSYTKDEMDMFKEYMRNQFIRSGGLIYVCSRYIKDRCLSFIEKELEDDLKKYMDMNKLVLLDREEYLKDWGIDFNPLLRKVEKAIAKLEGIDPNKKISIFITVDGYWNKVNKSLFDRLNDLQKEKNIRFIFRYYMEEIDKRITYYIFKEHDLIILDGVDKFEVIEPEDLFYGALLSLCQNKVIDYRYNKAVMRNEFFGNIGELVGGIVHDINNLLVSIIGYAQYSMEIEDVDEIRKCLNQINKLAFDGKKFTEKVKCEIRGDKRNSKDIYRFDYIVKNSIDMVKHKFNSYSNSASVNNLELVVDLNSNKHIYADEYELRHSIINIILNGIDAMEDGGIMTIRTYDEGDMVVLEISDTGKGMDEDMLDKIFNPYFSTRGSKGTGLGLSIAKRCFEGHKGIIKVESQVGEGTKFTIILPSADSIDDFEYYEEDNCKLMDEVVHG